MPAAFPLPDLSGGTGYPWLPPQYNPTLAALGYATGPKPTTPAPTVTTPAGATAAGGGAFNINPPPQGGQGAFGAVPGPISYPTTPYKEATNIYAGLPGLTDAAGRATLAQINADFTPEMTANLWNIANTYGVQSGMPGADIWKNKFFGNQIDKMLAERQKGLGNYNALLAELGKMGVDPNLAAQIADRNATYGAAPNPADAAAALAAAFRNNANIAANAGRSPAGGTGVFQNPYFTPRAAAPNARLLDGTNLTDPNAKSPAAGTGSYSLEMYPSEEEQAFMDEIAPRPGIYDWPTYNTYPSLDVSGLGHVAPTYNNWDNGIDYGYFGSTTPDFGSGFGGTPYNNFNDYNYDPLLEFDDSEFWGGGY